MARPRKADGEKRNKRMTVYFTPDEEKRLSIISHHKNITKTQVVNQALQSYFKTLENPPAPLKQASHEAIMKLDHEQVSGYICSQGHVFWIEWIWPSKPVACPACGEKNLKATWNGITNKGF